MSDSYTNLLYHIVFSTKDRCSLIKPEYEIRLYDYICGTLRRTGGISLSSLKDFSWQRGYGALTVSQSNVEKVRRYSAKQKKHHRLVSFRDELIQFLRANGIEN